MDLETAEALVSETGERALAAAMTERDPGSLAAAERLRRDFSADLAAAALAQVVLRRKTVGKWGERALGMLLTPDGVEQATRAVVARWRANRLKALGCKEVWDLGCGIGADALAFAETGLEVVGVELDPATAVLAGHNLGDAGRVLCADATTVDLPDGAAIYLDPARRDARGRTWDLARLSPPWEMVMEMLASGRLVVAKLGPGLSHSLLPEHALAEWVSHRGDVVECSVWAGPGVQPGRAATLLAPDGTVHRLVVTDVPSLDVAPVGGFLAEPDGAAIRAGLLPQLGDQALAWQLRRGIAYLSADAPTDSPWLTWFEVTDVLPYDEKALCRIVRERGLGTLEIKKRGIDIDPAELRKRLRPSGKGSATVVLTPTVEGTKALVCRRVRPIG